MSKSKQERVKKWLRLVLAVLLALLVLAAAAIVIAYFVTDHEPASTVPHPQLVIDPNAGDRVTPTPAPTEPGVAISGWGKMIVPAGATEVATELPNSIRNEGWYYLTFELYLKDTDEVLFTTGLIPPGQYCNAVTLNRAMEPGEYPAILRVQPYRMSDLTPTNNAALETVLVVE